MRPLQKSALRSADSQVPFELAERDSGGAPALAVVVIDAATGMAGDAP